MKTIQDVITNKKIVFYGDSITHNWEKYDHDYNLTHKEDPNYVYGLGYNYVKMLNDVCHFKSVENFSVSGGCYANRCAIVLERAAFRNFPHQIMHSLDALKEAEVIFVMFGTNDYSEQVPFGDYKDFPTSGEQGDMNFYQGMNFGFKTIKDNNPNAMIFVINCLNRTIPINNDRTYNYSLQEYNLAIAHMCRIYGLNLIDVSHLYELDNFPGRKKDTYSDDGLHPNEKGYERLTQFILSYPYEK